MKRKELRKMVIVVSLVTVLAIVVPVMSGCLGAKPATPPEAAPPEAAPPEAPAAAESTYHWRCVGPLEAWETQYLYGHFSESVAKMSGGRIIIDQYSSGELMPIEECHKAVADGTVEMAYISYGFTPGCPFGELESGLPLSQFNSLEGDGFWEWGGGNKLLNEWAESAGVHVLADIAHDPCVPIFTEPIESLDDWRGLKIFAHGSTAKILEKLGISTVYIPVAEVYTSLATGIVDGAIWGSIVCYEPMGFMEHCKYYLDPPFFDPFYDHIMVNLDLWNSLSEQDQWILQIAANESANWQELRYYVLQRRAIERTGATMCTLPEEDMEEFRAAAISYWDEYAEIEGPMCEQAVQMLKNWNAILGRPVPGAVPEVPEEYATPDEQW